MGGEVRGESWYIYFELHFEVEAMPLVCGAIWTMADERKAQSVVMG